MCQKALVKFRCSATIQEPHQTPINRIHHPCGWQTCNHRLINGAHSETNCIRLIISNSNNSHITRRVNNRHGEGDSLWWWPRGVNYVGDPIMVHTEGRMAWEERGHMTIRAELQEDEVKTGAVGGDRSSHLVWLYMLPDSELVLMGCCPNIQIIIYRAHIARWYWYLPFYIFQYIKGIVFQVLVLH